MGYVIIRIENKDKEESDRRYLQHSPASTRSRYSLESYMVPLVDVVFIIFTDLVAQGYHVTSETLGHEFDPGKRDFSH